MIGTTFSLYLNPLSATFVFNQLNSLGIKRSFQQSTQKSVAYSPIGNPIVRSPQFAPRCSWEIDTILSETEFSSLQALIALYQKRIVNNAGVLPYVVLYDGRIQWSEKGSSSADATKFGDNFEVSGGVLSYFANYLVTLTVPRDWFEPLGGYHYRVRLNAIEVGPLGPGYGLYDAPYPAFDANTLPSTIVLTASNPFLYGIATSTNSDGNTVLSNVPSNSTVEAYQKFKIYAHTVDFFQLAACARVEETAFGPFTADQSISNFPLVPVGYTYGSCDPAAPSGLITRLVVGGVFRSNICGGYRIEYVP